MIVHRYSRRERRDTTRTASARPASPARLCVVPLLALLVVLGVLPAPARAQADTCNLEPLDSLVTLDVEPVEVDPSSLLSEGDRTNLTRLVCESWLFGIPLAVRIERVDEPPESQDDIQAAAEDLLADEDIESAEDADDGLVLLVQVPSEDRTQTTAAFAAGPNFFPLGGITPERLDGIINETMGPLLSEGEIGQAVIDGVTWLTYIQLFESSPRLERSDRQQWLARITNGPLVAVGLAVFAATVILMFWIRSATRAAGVPAPEPISSPFAAAAIARGRADEAVATGAILRLIEIGAVETGQNRRGRLVLRLTEEPATDDGFLALMWDRLAQAATPETGVIPAGGVRRLRDAFGPPLLTLENNLARNGYFAKRAKTQTVWLWIAAVVAVFTAFYLIAPAIISMARYGIFAGAGLLLLAGIVIWWAQRRSWTTDAGRRALDAWLARTATDAPQDISDRWLFTLMRDQDSLAIDHRAQEDPFREDATRTIMALRGFGPA